MKFNFSEIEDAFLFSSFDGSYDKQAILDRETGTIHYQSEYDDLDEEWSEEDFDPDRHVVLPDKRELDLGSRLVHRFVREKAPELSDDVYRIFSRKGAYSRFKDLLSRHNLVDAWHDYEEASTKAALREWCAENRIELAEEDG